AVFAPVLSVAAPLRVMLPPPLLLLTLMPLQPELQVKAPFRVTAFAVRLVIFSSKPADVLEIGPGKLIVAEPPSFTKAVPVAPLSVPLATESEPETLCSATLLVPLVELSVLKTTSSVPVLR